MKNFTLKRTLACLTMLCAIGSLSSAGGKEKEVHAHTVTIQSLKFDPKSIEIKVGEVVSWTNADERDYSVDAKDGSFTSGNIRAGQSYEFRFARAGKYPYGCSYHPRMSGVVIVTEK